MVARMSPLFEFSGRTQLRAVHRRHHGAVHGLPRLINNDIKRVIAYSTLSQLGYMTVALGASVYNIAIFHLMTHAFFKALLFLAAGSVIIGMHHEQDMRKMGGLAKYMPITAITCWIGVPGTDRHAVLFRVLFEGCDHRGGRRDPHRPGCDVRVLVRDVGVFVTAFYSFRMLFMTFHGQASLAGSGARRSRRRSRA